MIAVFVRFVLFRSLVARRFIAHTLSNNSLSKSISIIEFDDFFGETLALKSTKAPRKITRTPTMKASKISQ